MLSWLVAGFAALLALLAIGMVRQASHKIDRLSHSYWELRHQFGELRSQVEMRSGAAPDFIASQRQEHAGTPPGDSFIPLSSLKR